MQPGACDDNALPFTQDAAVQGEPLPQARLECPEAAVPVLRQCQLDHEHSLALLSGTGRVCHWEPARVCCLCRAW